MIRPCIPHNVITLTHDGYSFLMAALSLASTPQLYLSLSFQLFHLFILFFFAICFVFFVFFKPAYLVITLHLKWKPKQPVGLCIKLEKKKNPFLFHINQQNPNPPFLFSLKSQPFFVTISRFKISTIFYCFQFHFYSISSI